MYSPGISITFLMIDPQIRTNRLSWLLFCFLMKVLLFLEIFPDKHTFYDCLAHHWISERFFPTPFDAKWSILTPNLHSLENFLWVQFFTLLCNLFVVVDLISCVRLFCDPMDCILPVSSCPWDFPGKNTRMGCYFLLQGIFPTQGSSLHLLHW